MKNTPSLKLLSRWIFAPLLVACLLAWEVSPAYPNNTVSRVAQSQKINAAAIAAADSSADLQDIKDRIKELEAKERQNFALVLDDQRKKIDWWFSFLAVLTAVMAIGGALIPFLMARKDKEIIEQDKKAIEQDKEQIRILRDEVRGMKDEADGHLKRTRQNLVESEKILNEAQSGTPAASGKKVDEAIEIVRRDINADFSTRLRAEAVAASQSEYASRACSLWIALAELEPGDVMTQFNAGYWSYELGDRAQGAEKLQWLRTAGKYYTHALSLKSDMHEAASNLGLALAAEAEAVAATELATAIALWQQAGEKYQMALSLKPDMHDAANNWGSALDNEAHALAKTDLSAARTLWQRAGEKYQQALRIKPDYHDVANNWGAALAAEAGAIAATELAAARVLWKQAGEKYQMALSLKPDMHYAANNWGNALDNEAHALAKADLSAAHALWQRAGEKYQQALRIKPDSHDAANNWGAALAAEAGAIAATELAAARVLWKQAGEKYQMALSFKPDMHEAANNWGNALANEAEAIAENELAIARVLWAQAGEKYQMALSIKSDMHEAANNWGTALLIEARAITSSNAEEFKRLLDQAEQLLLKHANAATDAESGQVAYNLACVSGLRRDVQACLKWLQVSQDHKSLPDCEYLYSDKDLDAVRNAPEFVEWLESVCGSTSSPRTA